MVERFYLLTNNPCSRKTALAVANKGQKWKDSKYSVTVPQDTVYFSSKLWFIDFGTQAESLH